MLLKIILIIIGEVLVMFFFIDITFFADWLEDIDPKNPKPWYKKGWISIMIDIGVPIAGLIIYGIILHDFDGSCFFTFIEVIKWLFK